MSMKHERKSTLRKVTLVGVAGISLWLGGCGAGQRVEARSSTLAETRRQGETSSDADTVAAWMLDELLAPDGDVERARKARSRLDELKAQGMWASLARGIDDTAHGRLKTASDHFLESAKAARESDDAFAPIVAWYAAEQAIALKSNTDKLYDRWKEWIKVATAEPKNIGFRARTSLVEWKLRESYAAGSESVEELAVREMGCVTGLRMAGPFGNGAAADATLPFAPDTQRDWPIVWPPDVNAGHRPKQIEVEQEGCLASPKEGQGRGVFYARADIELTEPTDLLLTMNNAVEVRVNGKPVLTKSTSEWGSWTKAGVRFQLPKGVHRIQGKLINSATSLSLLRPDGTPAKVTSLAEPAVAPSVVVPTQVTEKVNVLRDYVGPSGVTIPESAVRQYLTASLALWENEPEAAALLIEPLVKEPNRASGIALTLAADVSSRDPIFSQDQARDLVRELHVAAAKRDPRLWESELNRVSSLAKSKGLQNSVEELRKLTERYPEVPGFLEALARAYGELGWKAEHRQAVLARAARFPDDLDGLFAAAQAYEESGETQRADALYERVRELDPDTEVFVGRAIERRDYATAIAELKKLQARRPHRKELALRLEELLQRGGGKHDVIGLLEQAVAKEPTSGAARLELADYRYARGDEKSLESMLVEAVRDGANTGALKGALDLVEGMTELERFRLDSQSVIREYEASGKRLEGTAARVLDYMTVWVRSDGSSRLLEHEILKIQSSEAITEFSEQNVGEGVILKARVIKQDGSILEPELVPGKPTITFPHVEIGDYIETERLFGTFVHAEGEAYEGPNWFFREQNVAYARSEFIFIAPKDRNVDFAYHGGAPEPKVHDEGYFRVYHFRVDESPAAPNEPYSVPISEYLPNVHVSWGLNLERRLNLLSKLAVDTTPVDPRLVRIAKRIVEASRAKTELGRAKALYHWVMDNVRPAEEEDDGRRSVVGKKGNRWSAFSELCRALGIEVHRVVARNALFPEPQGDAEHAAQFSERLLRVGSGPYAWVQLNEQYAPFGYVPSYVRGAQGHLFTATGSQPVTIPTEGVEDRISFNGQFKLAVNGAADGGYDQVFAGRYGAALRQGLAQVGEGRTKDVIQTQILAKNLQGALLRDHAVQHLDDVDVPMVIHMDAEVARFAIRTGAKLLSFEPPFAPRLSQFATLATRQTPFLMRSDQDWHVNLVVELPPGARASGVNSAELAFGAMHVSVKDRVEGNRLILERHVRVPAGRVSPADYAQFVRFTRDADAALGREISVELP